jgi:hypothetical protein
MRANLKELAQKNMPALIGCMLFVVLVVVVLVSM